MEDKEKTVDMAALPTTAQLEKELRRERYNRNYAKVLRSTLGVLIVTAAISVLVAVLLLPVLRIYGTSMSPTLDEGNIVVSLKTGTFQTSDVVAFYYNNKILVKRVMGGPGDWINIDREGNIYVNNQLVDEPYLTEKAFGDCNIELPYQVPENRWFVLGDNRSVSVDSRNTTVGCVAEEQLVGRLVFCIWPMSNFGFVE